MKNFFLKTGLTLLCLIIGLGSAWGEDYELVTTAPTDWSGSYLIAYVNGTSAYVYNGTDSGANNGVSATISSNKISSASGMAVIEVASMTGGYSLKVVGGTNNGKYLSGGTKNGTTFNTNAVANSLSMNTDGTVKINNNTSTSFQFNSASDQQRFRYFASAQKGVKLFKKVENVTPKTYTVTFDAGTNGTCSTSSLTETSAGAGVTLPSCTANTNYTFVGWSTTSNPTSADAGTAGENYKPSADCTLYAYYTYEAPKHTAYFYSNGSLYTSEQYAEGAAITLPSNLPAISSKTFVGWVTSTIDGTTNTTPDFVESATMDNNDVYYYAVYATQTGSGSSEPTLVNSTSGLVAGNTYHIASGKYFNQSSIMGANTGGNNFPVITASQQPLALTLGGNATDGWTFSYTDGGTTYYLDPTGTTTSNYLKRSEEVTDYGKFSISFSNDAAVITSKGKSSRNILRYNGTNNPPMFSCYSSGQGAVYLFSKGTGASYSGYCTTVSAPTKNLTSIEVTGTPAEFWKGDAFNHTGMTVTATYDDSSTEDVTASAEFSTPDMSTAGEKTVTVTYQDQTDTYNITVNTIANTQATAYTVAQAKELIDAGKDLSTEVYVAGKISQVDSYNSTYKSITYWISADGTTTDQFEVYSGKGLDNANFSSKDDVQVGADVIVYGVIKKFNTTYEFDKNNYLVSYSYTPPTTDFIKTPTATVKVLDPISIKNYINGEYSSYDITTSIDGKTQKDYEFVCIYDQIRFCKAGTYVVDVTGTSGSDTQNGQVTFTVTPTGAELSSVTIGGTLTKTTYTVGESFDRTGLTLTANCSDGSHANVTDEAEWEASPATITDGTTKVTVTATYCGMTDTKEYNVTVNADYATLPFVWEGGVSADFTAQTGVTADGLGSDYAASNAPYRIKLDTNGDYFQVKTNEAIGICTVGVKMLGGATASSIKVQGSADGESFTDVETLTISGKQNDVLSLFTTSNLDESYRYVRFVFTKGSNVGVGPITIAKPDNTPTYTVTVASDIEHGTVTTSADRAKENDEITVTVNPDTHYHLATLYYTEEGDATQNPITATDDVYSFTMPATNVTVSATFEEDAKYTVTIETPTNGTLVVKHGDDVVTSGAQFAVGEVLDITATPAEGYKFRNWQAVDGTTHTFTSGTKWTMTASDVTIKANFDPADQKYLISWNVNGTVTNQQVNAGSALEAPTMTGKTLGTREFVGWTEDALVKNDTIPTYVTLGTATKDVTYYAVFADREEVTAAVPTSITAYADGNFYIVDAFEVDGTTHYYAMDGSANSAGNIVATDITNAVTLNDNGTITIDETATCMKDAMKYNITLSDGKYLLKNLLTNKYIKKASTKNDLKNNETGIDWTILSSMGGAPRFCLECEGDRGIFLQYAAWNDEVKEVIVSPRFKAYATSNRGKLQANSTNKQQDYSAGYTYFVPATPIALSNFATHEVSVSQYGSTTLCMPEDYVMPEGLTGKIVTANEAVDSKGDGYYTLTFQTKYTAGDIVPAGECLVLSGNQGSYYIAPGETTAKVSEDNLLHGDYVIDTTDSKLRFLTIYDEENASSNYYYKLATDKNKENFGWYWGNTTGEPFIMTSNERAYLVIDKGTAGLIRGFALDEFGEEDITTFIEGLTNEEINKSGRIYNLQGQMVNKLQKGINIVNGKKVIR